MIELIGSPPPFVKVLYGSVARGDDDALSDLDLLVIHDHNYVGREISLPSASVVHYTWDEFAEMSSYGSLFLRHLRHEGRIVGSDRQGSILYRQLLDTLPYYRRAMSDLGSFELAISDSEHALHQGGTSVEFELASLATVMRHCAILGSYLLGSEVFTRTGAVDLCCDRLGLGEDVKAEFRRIYTYRTAMVRDLPFSDSPSMPDGLRSARIAKKLLDGVKDYASRTAVS